MPFKDPEEHGISQIYDIPSLNPKDASNNDGTEHDDEPEQAKSSRRSLFGGNNSRDNDTEDEKKRQMDENAPPKLPAVAHVTTVLALVLHATAALRSYSWLTDDPLECCGTRPTYANHVKTMPIVYLALLAVDLVLLFLAWCGRRCGKGCKAAREKRDPNEASIATEDPITGEYVYGRKHDDDDGSDTGISTFMRVLFWFVIGNSIIGSLVALSVVYLDKSHVLFLLAAEAGAAALWCVTLCASRRALEWHNFCTYLVRFLLPWVPILATIYVLINILQDQGGVCFVVANDEWTVDGCQLCEDGWPPKASTGLCPHAGEMTQTTYCGQTPEHQFCYFDY